MLVGKKRGLRPLGFPTRRVGILESLTGNSCACAWNLPYGCRPSDGLLDAEAFFSKTPMIRHRKVVGPIKNLIRSRNFIPPAG